MMKKHFTDGLLQLAIVLSLLRTDINNYLNSYYGYYPEIQEVILGSSSAYTQTHYHQNSWNQDIGYPHPKSIDNYYANSVFRDLHSLSQYRQYEGRRDTVVSAWLTSGPTSGFLQSESATPSDTNNNQEQSQAPDNPGDSLQDGAPQSQDSGQPEGAFGELNSQEHPFGAPNDQELLLTTTSSDLTKEVIDDLHFRQNYLNIKLFSYALAQNINHVQCKIGL